MTPRPDAADPVASSDRRPRAPRVPGQVSAAGKVMAVLATFSRERPSQTLTQIARSSGLALSTVHRVVREMEEWGALERGDDASWHVGLRLWEVASGCPRGQILREIALPFLQDLYEATHENIQLAVREGTELVFVERIAGHRSVELLTMVGGRFPITATGMGRVLLAYALPEIQEAVLAEPIPRRTPFTVTDPVTVQEQLRAIRREQVFVSDRRLSETTVAVAAPIRMGRSGPVHAALGVVVASAPATDRIGGLRRAVLGSAQAISDALGARVPRPS